LLKISFYYIFFSALVLIAFFGIIGCAHTGNSGAPALQEDMSGTVLEKPEQNRPGIQEDEIVEEEITDDELFLLEDEEDRCQQGLQS